MEKHDRKNRNNGMSRSVQSGKHQNTWRKGKLQISGNIRSGHHQTKKGILQKNNKFFDTKHCRRNLFKRINT